MMNLMFFLLFLFLNFHDLLMDNQNPQKYAVRKVISRDRIEKHMQGMLIMH